MITVRQWSTALLGTAVATLLCLAWVDRPTAEFFFLNVRDSPTGHFIRTVFLPSLAVPVLAFGVIVSCAFRSKQPCRSKRAHTLLLYSWAILFALSTERILKHIFGRQTPREFLLEHRDVFIWLHGNDMTAFPSGTAIAAFSIATLIWLTTPKLRVVAALVALLPCAAVILLAEHFVADVIAGAFLGALVGWATLQLIGEEV